MFLCYGTGKWRLSVEHIQLHTGHEIYQQMVSFLQNGVPVFVEYMPRQYCMLYNEDEVALACRMVLSIHKYWENHQLAVEPYNENDMWNFAVFTTVPVQTPEPVPDT